MGILMLALNTTLDENNWATSQNLSYGPYL